MAAAISRSIRRFSMSSTEGALRVLASDVRSGVPGAVGNTPLIRLRKLSEETGCEVRAREAGRRDWAAVGCLPPPGGSR